MPSAELPSSILRSRIRNEITSIHRAYDLQVYMEMDSDPNPVGFRRNREKAMLSCIRNGDVERIETYLIPAVESVGRNQILPRNILAAIWEHFSVGQLSETPLKQMLYLFISNITLCTRAAIDGGLPEHRCPDRSADREDHLPLQPPTDGIIPLCDHRRQAFRNARILRRAGHSEGVVRIG